MGMDDLIVDSVSVIVSSDSEQSIDVYWSKSPRPFNRNRLPFNQAEDASLIIDRSSPFFCESCDVYVRLWLRFHYRSSFIYLNLRIFFSIYR